MQWNKNSVAGLASALAWTALAPASAQQGIAWQQQAKLLAPNASAYAYFGRAIALEGDTLVVGANEADAVQPSSGAVYVFGRNGSVWTHLQTLLPVSGGLFFGSSVALEGDTLAVGATRAGPGNEGAAHVFTRTAGVWTERAVLHPPPPSQPTEDPMEFGNSIALDGDVLVVGARNYDDQSAFGPGVGAAYVFRGAAASWTFEQQLGPPISGQGFGARVHANSGIVFVHQGNGGLSGIGALPSKLYVYEHNGSQWLETALLTAPVQNGTHDGFGGTLDFDGTRLVVSAYLPTSTDFFAPHKGGAITYLRSGGAWVLEAILSQTHPQVGGGSGSVSLDGDLISMGSPADDGVAQDAGSAWVHRLTGNLWQPRAEIAPADLDAGEYFGGITVLENHTLVVSNWNDDDLGVESGSVYVFTLQDVVTPPTSYCAALVNSQGCTPVIATSGSPSVSSTNPFTISVAQVINNKSGLFFYGLAGRNEAPFNGGSLCAAPPLRRTGLQLSGGNAGPNDCSGTYTFDFNAWTQSGSDPQLVAGLLVNGQFWHRDPPSPSGFGLSGGIEFELLP